MGQSRAMFIEKYETAVRTFIDELRADGWKIADGTLEELLDVFNFDPDEAAEGHVQNHIKDYGEVYRKYGLDISPFLTIIRRTIRKRIEQEDSEILEVKRYRLGDPVLPKSQAVIRRMNIHVEIMGPPDGWVKRNGVLIPHAEYCLGQNITNWELAKFGYKPERKNDYLSRYIMKIIDMHKNGKLEFERFTSQDFNEGILSDLLVLARKWEEEGDYSGWEKTFEDCRQRIRSRPYSISNYFGFPGMNTERRNALIEQLNE